MSRDISAAIQTELDNYANGDVLHPTFLLYLGLDSGDTYLWTGVGDVDFDGNTYQGVGALGEIAPIIEDSKMSDVRFAVSLSNIPAGSLPDFVDEVTINDPTGRDFKIWLGFLNDEGKLQDALLMTSGFIDSASVSEVPAENGEFLGSVKLTLASDSTRLGRTKNTRMTDQAQQALFTGDKGFEFVSDVNLREVVWGRSTTLEDGFSRGDPTQGGGGGGGTQTDNEIFGAGGLNLD